MTLLKGSTKASILYSTNKSNEMKNLIGDDFIW